MAKYIVTMTAEGVGELDYAGIEAKGACEAVAIATLEFLVEFAIVAKEDNRTSLAESLVTVLTNARAGNLSIDWRYDESDESDEGLEDDGLCHCTLCS